MIGDDFYSTIKLKSGEEIFTKVAPSEEDESGQCFLILSHPVVIEELSMRGKKAGYKMTPWLKTTTDDMFIISFDDVLLINESSDIEMITYYQDFIRKNSKTNYSKLDRDMGYISTVNEAKEVLEKLFDLDSYDGSKT